MELNLLDLTTKKLLQKFGAGDHKPGSGSAAAFKGLLSSHLLHTVISLTLEPERVEHYKEFEEKLVIYDKRIKGKIIPKLEELFQEDSVQFDKVIKLRDQRNSATDIRSKILFEQEHLKELEKSTEIPLEIARLCEEVASVGNFVFKNGFQSARGDTCVAQNDAVSAIQGCISIADLNLLSFFSSDWTQSKRVEIEKLNKSLISLLSNAQSNSAALQEECIKRHQLQEEFKSIINATKNKRTFKNAEIENLAIRLQNIVWNNKEYLWRKEIGDPIDILKPDVIFKKILGYQYYRVDSLDDSSSNVETAGIIDQNKKVVFISKKFNKVERNFTSAHELGHAIFHKQAVIHRDRPLDGSRNANPKDFQEYQADKFATYFIMPKKEIIEVFSEWFGTSKFVVNEDNSYRLLSMRPSELKRTLWNIRGLSRKLASADKFGQQELIPINSIFGVSVEAMAIRLEELNLVYY